MRARRSSKRLTGWKGFLRDVLVILVAAVLISFLVKTFLFRSFYIPSESMRNTLQVDDRVIVNELQPRLFPLAHGDVVVFRDPGGWMGPGEHLIKRVIGLPGDRVACCNALGQLTVNGVPVEEPYLDLPPGETSASANKPFSVTVPKDSLWVMGDNRNNSADSRFHTDEPGEGFVPYDDVVGRAVVISWPVSRWTWLDDYPAVFADVERRR